MDKNYYPKVFLEECKYIFKEKNINTFINDDLQETLMNPMTQIILMILMLRKSIPLFFWFLMVSCKVSLLRVFNCWLYN